MITLPLTLELDEKPKDDRAIYFELEAIAAAKGGSINRMPSIPEIIYDQNFEEMPTLRDLLTPGGN
jgi:hypothetical protein